MKSQVDAMVNRWFEETFSHMQSRSEPPRELDIILIGALHCGRNYANGILVLLRNQNRLPAAALLRALCELEVRLFWCLQAPDKTDAVGKDNCYQRFRRWDYARASEHRKMLKHFLAANSASPAPTFSTAIGELDQDIAKFEAEQLRCMPDVASICNQLPGHGPKIYSQIYQNFSSAVHINMRLIRQTMQPSSNGTLRLADPLGYDEAELTSYCVSMAHDINHVVRTHYGWNCDKLRREYDVAVNALGGINKEGI